MAAFYDCPATGYDPGTMQPFLDVQNLMTSSLPRPNYASAWSAAAAVGMIGLLVFTGLGAVGGAGQILGGVAMLGLLFSAMWLGRRSLKKSVLEQQKLQAIQELITLRRWSDAAAVVQELLGSSMRTHETRIHALIYLAGVLARYHRFEEAEGVYDSILKNVRMDSRTTAAIKLGRAMCMLRNDQLYDADRAIADLRRQVRRGSSELTEEEFGQPIENDIPGAPDLAGLTLVEMYRDLKTGHPQEVIESFTRDRNMIRDHFGHRVGDAYALAAKSADLLGQSQTAQEWFEHATLLVPLAELKRRYPEIESLETRYKPSAGPYEAATNPAEVA